MLSHKWVFSIVVEVSRETKGVFGTASLPFLQLRSSSALLNTFNSKNSAPRKRWSWRLTPCFFFLEHLKGYSSFWSFILPRGVVSLFVWDVLPLNIFFFTIWQIFKLFCDVMLDFLLDHLLHKLHCGAAPWWSWWSRTAKTGAEQSRTCPKYHIFESADHLYK